MTKKNQFELVFVGGISARYRRFHKTFDEAKDHALEILYSIEDRNAHPAIIYGPGCERYGGVTIA